MIRNYHRGMTTKTYPMPFTRIELIVFAVHPSGLEVLLIKRTEAPFAGQWALPGGVLRIDTDMDLESAAQRIAVERLGTPVPYIEQWGAVGGASRDPRAPWALSIVYQALVPGEQIQPRPGKRIAAIDWRPASDAATDTALAFDHRQLIDLAMTRIRSAIDRLELPAGYFETPFTLTELQATCEAILGHRLDKSSFRRKLAERGLVQPVEGQFRQGAFRPAQLFELVAADPRSS
ncbi:NUDIX hydrolase [Piscinibacterium candidicorallinum]